MRIQTVTIFIFVILVEFFALSNAFANEKGVAKIIILKGKAEALLKDGTKKSVILDEWIPEGAKLITQDRSFVKLLFIDKSEMTLNPKSEMIITSFPKKEAGIISLVKGELRSKVTKDYMQMDDKSKSKLYIKTKSAAMGIRGTDFQVNFNEINGNTSLITFEGAVAMAGIEKEFRERSFNQDTLERAVSSEKAVLVKEGQFSAVTQISDRALVPTLLSPNQLESLKNGANQNEQKPESNKKDPPTEVKNFKSPIPPGADSTVFSNNNKEFEKQVVKASDQKDAIEKVAIEIQKEAPKNIGQATGFYNADTGAIKFPAGSVIDLKTVNVIPPPANAQFDSNTQTFILPQNFGKIDPLTGSYRTPEGIKLTDEGKFVATNDPTKLTATTSRSPASIGPNTNGVPVGGLSIIPTFLPPTITLNLPGSTLSPGVLPPPNFDAKLQDLANQKIQDITNTINQANETGQTNPNSKVRFIFNAQ